MTKKVINLPSGQSIERLEGDVYLVRGHKDDGKYGSEWQWITVAVVNEKTVEIKGLCVANGGKFGITDHINLAEFFRSRGVESGWYERIKNGKIYRYVLR